MAGTTKTAPAAEVRKTDAGDYELGAEVDGAWVPFGHKDGGYVEQLVERAKETAESDS